MSNLAPGWYDDGSGTQRWWDGSAWTEDTAQPTVSPDRPKSRKPLIIACAAVAVIAAVVVALVVALTGGTDSPGDVVKKFYSSTNCDQVRSYSSAAEKSGTDGTDACTQTLVNTMHSNIKSLTIKSSTVSGNTARVLVTITTPDGEHRDSAVNLVKENGAWKIDHFGDDPDDH